MVRGPSRPPPHIRHRSAPQLHPPLRRPAAFTDSSGDVFAGKEEVLRAWDGFFAAFPDYRNEWSDVLTVGGIVVAIGRSVCSTEAALDGPAIWTARTEGDRVSEWRVYDNTPESRRQLGLQPRRLSAR